MKKIIRLAACLSLGGALLFSADTGFAQSGAPDMSAHILTPPPARTPRINGARVFGVRPGSDFLFTVAATGERPMTFSAEGLPKGLAIDAETGRITGRVKRSGEYTVRLRAKNALGEYERDLRIVAGDKIALTPPMGWNSWNCWARDVTREQVLASARAMVEKGLVNHGWTYINIDDGWQGQRGGKYNAIQPNTKFPDMKGLADEIHGMGLKIGIYSTPWIGTYAAHIGSYSDNPDGVNEWIKKGWCNEHYRYQNPGGDYWKDRMEMYIHGRYSFVDADVKQWVDWGIDYLKYDWSPNDLHYTQEMHDALRKCGRDIVYSISNNAPYADAPLWMELCHCWRTTGDIRDTWKSMSAIGFAHDRWMPFTGPGHWADPDMLVVGMVGWGPKLHYTKLTADEQYTHISLWALLSAPLLIGCDLAQLDDFTISLLTNDEVIDINQDPLGYQAAPLWRDGNRQVIYMKPLEDGSVAVGLFNRDEKPAEMKFTMRQLGMRDKKIVRDVWRQQDIATLDTGESYTTQVAPHGVVLLKVYPGNPTDRCIGKVER